MAYAEDLYNRLTSGMVNSDQYLAKLSDRGQPSEAEMAGLRASMQTPRSNDYFLGREARRIAAESMQGQPMPSQAEMEALQRSMIGQAPQSQMQGMGGMTPEETNQYLQSFTDAGINLTPGAGIARGLLNMDQAITNATTAPGNLNTNQLQNIASGNAYNAQGQVSPYSLGLGQQMYNPEMLRGLLGF
jgi:hypothetical protein